MVSAAAKRGGSVKKSLLHCGESIYILILPFFSITHIIYKPVDHRSLTIFFVGIHFLHKTTKNLSQRFYPKNHRPPLYAFRRTPFVYTYKCD